MAELLVYVAERHEGGAHEPGHIIVAMPNGHGWGVDELSHERFAIVSVPHLSADMCRAFVDVPLDPFTGHTAKGRARAVVFDLTHLMEHHREAMRVELLRRRQRRARVGSPGALADMGTTPVIVLDAATWDAWGATCQQR